ncbi:RES family NAD+ phosphorylase [Mucilaginibacter ginsenosidivorax]|uniref:RES domain-containing protein n=1 Tax=Mucilaginibacter ginsenosidivorax TaxID=862126 RepID=A0A5B8VZM2_9SPHI|nr:RES family NAD+ phosphorylase [Mucilaginibacter ginsenosidivorax]QEC77130.1 RES domain-containing protein [Mucilaginibacter ginsenosidivorax]
MLVYRIALEKSAYKLVASGRAARWNPNDVEMIYTASSRSLACLENVVHRSQAGLTLVFNVMTIAVPDGLTIVSIKKEDLPLNWLEYDQMLYTQQLGEKWINEKQSAILAVPSSIIEEEINYLINPKHDDFKAIRLVKTEPFAFDKRIKQ